MCMGKIFLFKYDFVRDSGENPNVKQYFSIKRNNNVIFFSTKDDFFY